MPRDNGLYEARNRAILKLYNDMRGEGITMKKILEVLEKAYFLKPRTLEGIIYGEYQKRKLKILEKLERRDK